MTTKGKDAEVMFKRLGAVGEAKKTADGHATAMVKWADFHISIGRSTKSLIEENVKVIFMVLQSM